MVLVSGAGGAQQPSSRLPRPCTAGARAALTPELVQTALFTQLTEEQHSQLEAHWTERDMEPGTHICFADEEARGFFIVLHGTAIVTERCVAMDQDEGFGSSEEGLVGSHYPARIVQAGKPSSLVEHLVCAPRAPLV